MKGFTTNNVWGTLRPIQREEQRRKRQKYADAKCKEQNRFEIHLGPKKISRSTFSQILKRQKIIKN